MDTHNVLTLPNDKYLYLSRLKAFADDNLNVDQKMEFAFDRVENIVGKGAAAFSSFPTMFSKGFFPRVIKSQDYMVKTFEPVAVGMWKVVHLCYPFTLQSDF